MKPRAGAPVSRPVVGRLAAGRQHHARRVRERGEALGDLEAVDAGQLHVEQHDVWTQALGGLDRRLAVLGLTGHLEALRGQQHAREAPEARVVVDDQKCHWQRLTGCRVRGVRASVSPLNCPRRR
jgi:hypothetical protein